MQQPETKYSADDVIDMLDIAVPRHADYVAFHRHRYAYILNITAWLLDCLERDTLTVLDVGPHYQTQLLRKCFPELVVNTLGFDQDMNNLKATETHWAVDLNEPTGLEFSEAIRVHDLVVYSEVLEHLYTKAETVIDFLGNFIGPGGYLLLQTPNAVGLRKRIRMLLGQNPFEMIATSRQNHFREYTLAELTEILQECGYEIVLSTISNYFSPDRNWKQRAYCRLNNWIPAGLRDGITMVARKIS